MSLGTLVLFLVRPAQTIAGEKPAEVTGALRHRAVAVLRRALDGEERPARVRAAELLLSLDYPEGVVEVFQRDLAEAGSRPHDRIGIWRVMARAAERDAERDLWIEKILNVLLDPDAPDRVGAAEALAELGYAATKENAEQFNEIAEADHGPIGAYTASVLANSGNKNAEAFLAELVQSGDPATRRAAARAIGHLGAISPETQARLANAALREAEDSPACSALINAAAAHARDEDRAAWKDVLRDYAKTGTRAQRPHVCDGLAAIGGAKDLPLLARLLEDRDADVRVAAAWAVLRIDRRRLHHMPALDWLVIVLYAGAMVGIGWYYARRTATADDYLLGGRKMKPLNVGLSLFATLLSTITYLAWPGELIKWGPMMLAMICAYPLIYFVTGWFMIPFIMKLKITSAYELLETRLGLGVRMLGSIFFLAMRLMWMAVIIFATTDIVLVPLLGLDASATPYICAVLGLITVTYTAMGGLRAVVVTDVTQTLILFGGAILTMILITLEMGGAGAWWPTRWPAHWPEPVWGFSSTARVTFLGALMAHFTWWVCTAGSDQMAIQRYLATRDAGTARGVLLTSLVANTLVALILSAVGLALLAYFRANPHFITDGQTILSDPDKLYPRFIAFGLPMGLSGLVVAGLLAAAMSSLSSGVNSSCSVIAVDFIDRFRKHKMSEAGHVRRARYISVLVGVVVVVLTSGVGMVQGNLLAIAFKVVNLLTAPLFGLFFMAMFVRWATGPGTLVGAGFGLVVVILVNYWEEITGAKGISFIWAMPLSFVVQIGVGMLASLLPVGGRPPPLE